MIYDTSLLIDFLHGDDGAVETMEATTGVTTAINGFELLRGAHSTEHPGPAKALLDRLDILPFEQFTNPAQIGAELLSQDKYPGDADVLIAGIAKANDIEAIATRDQEFTRFDLNVISY